MHRDPIEEDYEVEEEEETYEEEDIENGVEFITIVETSDDRMDSDESNRVNHGRGKNKRPWKEMEDEILVQCLKELAADLHWKGENGFRNGYFGRLEKMIAERPPGCGLRASPHIESRVKYLKQKYCAITEILSKKGMYESTKGLWGMPFPHLDVLAEIYGKDRATREGVETFVDAVHNIETTEANPMLAYIGGGGPNVGDDDNDNETQSAKRTASSSSRKAKKHKSVKEKEAKDPLQEHVELFSRTLGLFISRMEAHFATMANVMTREQEMAEKSTAKNNTARVVAELLSLSFNSNQIIKATDIFAAEPSKMVLFSLPQQLKRQYVLDILNLSVGEPKAGSTSKQL
uniref:MLLE-like domain-containing protein n=1 Tax=Ananas comosus var. bracteatus TaxID=296719 RepID=A0A6V7QLX4_ANACO|nr:unnamed protein product [Ananas comosus var. bracteatus]